MERSSKGSKGEVKKNEVQQRIFSGKSNIQKHPEQIISKTNPFIDKNEFPALSEISVKMCKTRHSLGSNLKYSEKLKSTCPFQSAQISNINKNTSNSSKTTSDNEQCNFNRSQNASKIFLPKSETKFAKEASNRKISIIDSNTHSNQLQAKDDHLPTDRKRIIFKPQFPTLNASTPKHKTSPKTNLKSEDKNEDTTKTKKKKKRKSKLKRQVDLTSGKITILTPEVHLKILNQSNSNKIENAKTNVTDINNKEEYPELGISLSAISKDPPLNKVYNNLEKSSDKFIEKFAGIQISSEPENVKLNKEIQTSGPEEKNVTENKSKNKPVHPNDPITISIFDILSKDKIKPKEKDEGVSEVKNASAKKERIKKDISHPHNILDSSPAIKRGKERENPKPKKPSALKKIILLDRKMRREQFLMMKMKSGDESGKAEDNEQVSSPFSDKNDTTELNSDAFFSESYSDTSAPLEDQFEISNNHLFEKELSDNENKSVVELNKSLAMKQECPNEYNSQKFEKENADPQASTESCFIKDNLELCNMTRSEDIETEIYDKEKASKIVLHTRHFREYCDHLISKEIDDAVFTLLDDLARFQDRMHQKDPIKARMKRRMIFGIKEIKKHIKLKRLKCIIIAPDVENVETEGGLNDIIKDVKTLAADHHIPCIFALGRRALGKVCRKSVSVSCIGIFNYEGSEANFKKIMELQSQSLKDYATVIKKVIAELTEEQASVFIKAKKEAPETLHNIRSNFLREIFLSSENETNCLTYESD